MSNRNITYFKFEWDREKEKFNIDKHGIDFKRATQAFADPKRLVAHDEKHSQKEERYFCIGKIENKIVTVRFVYRDGKVRIFGAGFWRNGRKLYEEENK